jgi:methyltransferase family protein
MIAAAIKQIAGPRGTVLLRCLTRGHELPRWGNLRRTIPFSSTFGFERGTPIDRYYLHRFLDANRHFITGRVLEVQSRSYTERFGTGVTCSDTFDLDPGFSPTYPCDFTSAGNPISTGVYDCVLLPNTLQHFRDLEGGLANAMRVLRRGGAILASMAGLLPLTGDAPDYWRLSPDGWREKLAAAWPDAAVEVQGHGNCLAAVASQLGLAMEELSRGELDVFDPRFPVLTTVLGRAR